MVPARRKARPKSRAAANEVSSFVAALRIAPSELAVGLYARRAGKSSQTRIVIPSLRTTARDSRRTRRRMESTGLLARSKFSLRISLPARITAA
jgi:hypothetical protein